MKEVSRKLDSETGARNAPARYSAKLPDNARSFDVYNPGSATTFPGYERMPGCYRAMPAQNPDNTGE